jgi:hypothetical protein
MADGRHSGSWYLFARTTLPENPVKLLTSLFALGASLALFPRAAHADAVVEPDVVAPNDQEKHAIDRTWLYADDARIPAQWSVIAMTSASYANVSGNPFREAGNVVLPTKYSAFDANTAQPGLTMSVGGELGLFPHVSFMALGQLEVAGETQHANGGAIAGLRFLLTPLAWKNLRIVGSAGYLREAWEGPIFTDDNPMCTSGTQGNCWTAGNPNGDNGMWFQGAISGDIGRFRLVGNFHAEHVFAAGRDPLDIMVDLGATYRIYGGFRAGVEWVGQDLEETFSPGAEGGPRMFGGPIASLQLFHDRLTIVGGPSLGVAEATGEAPNFIARINASMGF